MGKIKRTAEMELAMLPMLKEDYSRRTIAKWSSRCLNEMSRYEGSCDKKRLKEIHKTGFLYSSVESYGIKNTDDTEYISDLDYLSLQPFNNSFTKWIEDIYTASRVLKDHSDVFRTIYFSIVQREGKQLILPNGGADREYTADDVIALLREKSALELRPVFWKSKKKRYQMSFNGDLYKVDGAEADENTIKSIISNLKCNCVVADPVSIRYPQNEGPDYDHVINLWIANDSAKEPEIKSAMLTFYLEKKIPKEDMTNQRVNESMMIDINSGHYCFRDTEYAIKDWSKITAKVKAISSVIRQITFYTMSISLNNEGSFKIVYFDGYPQRPPIPYNRELDEYLKSKLTKKPYSFSERTEEFKKVLERAVYNCHVKIHGRKGVRTYMQGLWEKSVRDDLRHTKGVSRSMKRWMHKHGFLSYRIWQYGITKDNYKDFVLSDYDYHWLNRINNNYQKWVNDKTTYRLIMEPLKEFVPKYYLSVFKVNGEPVITRQFDLPEHISESFEGALQLLKENGKLAFKPSAGTHGDGFYCLEYRDDSFWINGNSKTIDEVRDLIFGQKSFYVLTEYISMHDDLKKIYDKSVNTVRVVVVNSHGYDPRIMQQYIRIGSLRTGYTDNVGYGGICAMIDNKTGEIYEPQSIKDHYFYDCPVHPDTGTEIGGKLPNWEFMCDGILKISRYLGELEYLGYDVAITNDGMEILEINIHPDLHKVAEISEEFKEFFVQQKIRKAKANKIKLSGGHIK